jgi:hypothetical protein
VRSVAALVACVVPFVCSPTASAAPRPSFAIAYQAPEGAGCPTEDAVRASVTAELGYDPWDPVDDGTSPRIAVTIRGHHAGVRGRVEMRATDGRHLGARELEAASCAELAGALVLAIAVAIDPLRAVAPPPKPSGTAAAGSVGANGGAATSASAAVTKPASDTPPAVPAPPPHRPGLVDEIRLRVGFGVQGTIDAAPGPQIGFMGRVGFALRRFSLAVELRGDLPGSGGVDGGHVSASTMAAFFVPCVSHRVVAFCLLGGGGGQEVAGSGYLLSRSSWVPYAAVGARIEIELALTRIIALDLHVDLMAPITRAELYVGTERPQRVYRSEPVSSSLGLLLSTR